MSTSRILAALAVTALSVGPALAGDHDLATEIEGSGRYPAQTTVPADAYGWSLKSRTIRHGYSVWPEEFQLQGR